MKINNKKKNSKYIPVFGGFRFQPEVKQTTHHKIMLEAARSSMVYESIRCQPSHISSQQSLFIGIHTRGLYYEMMKHSVFCYRQQVQYLPFRKQLVDTSYQFVSYLWLQIITMVINHYLGNRIRPSLAQDSITEVMIYNRGYAL